MDQAPFPSAVTVNVATAADVLSITVTLTDAPGVAVPKMATVLSRVTKSASAPVSWLMLSMTTSPALACSKVVSEV